ncbi:hypothetical protein B0I00_1418 [Novosphingobium kunmingense]|uniref:DUF3037 family protein n=1 Tax=Novosphingobium kunmingense TaxID=1211806 RepID=A0A2N0HJY9_9SPHN|nr:hypothetical protein [Novosphingobium kunmingense]PKB19188.1 hypothetical protein B0I00_1418 [Novosphingobium kunmingense]
MAKSCKFAVIKFASHAQRDERLNVGLLVDRDGVLEVFHSNKLDKLRAISAAIEPADIISDIVELPDLANKLGGRPFENSKVLENLSNLTSFSFVQQGSFDCSTNEIYLYCVSDLLRRYVEPEPAVLRPVKKRSSKLRQDIRKALLSEKIMARREEGLDSHRVIYKHELSQGVVADFVLQNGAMHVVESVDATSDSVSLHRCLYEIAMSALTFEHARINFENQHVRPRLIYSSNAEIEAAISPSLYAAQHQGAEVINWESAEQRAKFITNFVSLAEPVDTAETRPSLFHASALPTRKLN